MILGACSAERSNIFSTAFHNTTARYNAYFYANQRITEVEKAIEENHQNNFNDILMVFSDVDSAVIRSNHEALDECIRKASIAIQRHPNSKWVDDSYILIGKARYYMGDFVNAIETFKYVNTKSKDDDTRHEALVWLMRTFIDYNEENNAIAVSDYLKKEKLNNRNYKLLELTRSYLDQRREDYDEMIKHLILIASDLKKKDNADRIYYIMAQIYQEKGFQSEAYNYYDECLKSNPEYEVSFYAKLNMAQVTDLADMSDVKKIRKYFKKLLKDRKNKEFKDKIYYEMANFEIKQDNYDQAIEYYRLSISTSTNNPRQKAYSYLELGKLYYEHFKEYETAKAYYDSTVTVLPKDDDLYPAVSQRQEILADFVTQINTIHVQDSLLALSKLDTTTLYAFIDQVIEEKRQKAIDEEENRKKAALKNSFAQTNMFNPFMNNNTTSASAGSTWYFYNQNAISLGQSEFQRIWGDRDLEDHWRRSNKSSSNEFTDQAILTTVKDENIEQGEATSLDGQATREQYLANIPFTEAEQDSALRKIEVAYYNLGKIYNFQLDEPRNATESFEILLDRFPSFEHKPEVLYLLYLIYKELDNPKYNEIGDQLVSEFPKTSFAKMVQNPNYREESNIASEKLKKYYKNAYELYEADSMEAALATIDEGIRNYPDNSFRDNIELLRILILGKTESLFKYKYELQQFENRFPESELINYVNELLETTEEFEERIAKEQEIKFYPFTDEVHFFVVIYPSEKELNEKLINTIDQFNTSHGMADDLKSGNLSFDEDQSLILINEFKNENRAISYYETFNTGNSPLDEFGSFKFHNFVISKENFEILYRTKGLEEYLSFFKKNYP